MWYRRRETEHLPLAELKLNITPKSVDRALAKAARDAKSAEPIAAEDEPEESESGSDLSGISDDDKEGAIDKDFSNAELMCSAVAPSGYMHFVGTADGSWISGRAPCTSCIKLLNLEKGPAPRTLGMGRNWCPTCKGEQQWQDHFGT